MISVRVKPELAERLDALTNRTHRPRSAYIRMALWAMLPRVEHMRWGQVAADYEDLAIKDDFEEITLGYMEDALKKTGRPATKTAGVTPPLKRTRAAHKGILQQCRRFLRKAANIDPKSPSTTGDFARIR